MPLDNLEYQYGHLPPRYRRADEGLLLKRFLSFFGEQLDKFDHDFETLFERVKSETATEEFVEFWCWSFFGWSWFPSWFTLDQKRAFYGDLATHLARRGTKKGIEGFLAAFGIHARVFNRSEYWEEFFWDDSEWMISAPLSIVVQIFPVRDVAASEREFWEEYYWEEAYFASESAIIEQADVEALLRFQAPLSQDIFVEYLTV